MPYFLCHASVRFGPTGANDPELTKTKVEEQVAPPVARVLRNGFLVEIDDYDDVNQSFDDVFGAAVAKLNELQAHFGYPDNATADSPDEWAYGSGGLHEGERYLTQDGKPWLIEVDSSMDASMRIVIESLQ
ncbi:MAG: hypothetical protein KJO43_05200 [Phycisphaerae bacterium]|nr:hypothetical protein [Phycisphaerae bacterium]NNF41766.1 hypothetical protein [Phycisphaerales bacterium]